MDTSVEGDGRGPAPIALFLYNRPDHARRTISALSDNDGAADSSLFVFSDGPANAGQAEAVASVRRVVREAAWPGRITVRESPDNLGLARSIVSGVSELVERHGRVIVLEDDLVTAPSFLTYVNEGLRRYAHAPHVMQIAAYLPPVEGSEPDRACFLPLTSSWGWATWKRAWDQFDRTAAGFDRIMGDAMVRREFNLGGAIDYASMLRDSVQGRNDSWAVRWYASVFLRRGLVLHPGRSLVRNIGFDGSGVHCDASARFDTPELGAGIRHFPDAVAIDERLWEAVRRYHGRPSEGAARAAGRAAACRPSRVGAEAGNGRRHGFGSVQRGARGAAAWLRTRLVRRRDAFRDSLARRVHDLSVRGRALAVDREFAGETASAPGVRVFPEAVVRNLHGDPQRIRIGAGSLIRGELLVFAHAGEVAVGRDCYVGDGTRIWSSARVTIGNRVLISHGVEIHDTNSHPIDAGERHAHFRRIVESGHPREGVRITARPVVIEEDAWIGFGATILKGVTIGRGAIVAAGAVVVTDVPPFSVVAGNPARVIRRHETQADAA